MVDFWREEQKEQGVTRWTCAGACADAYICILAVFVDVLKTHFSYLKAEKSTCLHQKPGNVYVF